VAYEMTVGLLVSDQAGYAQYRAEMTPLLEAAGGRFRYDFEVARTLMSDTGEEVNRVFVLQFRDRADKERFFSDTQYLEIRKRLFEPSVQHGLVLAEYSV
jgi:uncharacterized protein (DUF1330 family)